ncbi:glycosyltransferase [Rhodocytophaga aerolata]|uniref:Glycosyltransferase n=1 Tax=Rhodocytophaga aerolata TaxID=455078 RepID=A0ABT8RCK3_9BACT|nr:glycosyltransferase [Rhodocytophaga aerolata]MDO1449790.1 glycosyltransferase [Rhodocytophaga aerolata]
MRNLENVVVQSLWIGEELTRLHQTCIQSFINNGHVFHLYVYGVVNNIPAGVILKDANEILSYERIFIFDQPPYKGKYAPFSDLFRYHLLYLKGGWWVDVDVFCLKFFDIQETRIVCTTYNSGNDKENPSNFILKFPKEDSFVKELIQKAEGKISSLSDYVEIGPSLIDNQTGLKSKNRPLFVPYFYFAPVSHYHTRQYIVYSHRNFLEKLKEWIRPFFRPRTAKARTIHPRSFGIHLWNEVWRQGGLDENRKYHTSCLYEKLIKQYKINHNLPVSNNYEYSNTR